MSKPPLAPGTLVVIAGPTASGKTRRAVATALALDGEVVSADSRQLYRGMDIGTGKDLGEYGPVAYHLIDTMPAGARCSLFDWLAEARRAVDDIMARGRQPVVCGGTGLYLEALVKGYDVPPVAQDPGLRASLEGKTLDELTRMLAGLKPLHNTTDVDTVPRAVRAIEIALGSMPEHEAPEPYDARVFAVDLPVAERRRRITERLYARIEEGLVDEVRRLLDSGLQPDDLMYYGLEYRFVTEHVMGRTTLDQMISGLETAIHRFAKRQLTWLRGMERRGTPICWLPYTLSDDEWVDAVKHHLQP